MTVTEAMKKNLSNPQAPELIMLRNILGIIRKEQEERKETK